jgi:hypothetical protein
VTASGRLLTIIVRGAHERTEDLCLASIRDQSDAAMEVVHERPFLAALRRSVQIGIDSAREFTLCVDADIVFAPNAIARMIRQLQSEPEAFFTCGYLLDRFYGEPKARGVHLYRTRYLEEARAAIPTSESVERPETSMKSVLLARGRTSAYVRDRVLGLHGFGQYYRDVFRTIACRGQKSPEQFAPLMDRFSRRAGTDMDLRVALWALTSSVGGEVSLDVGRWSDEFERLRSLAALAERGALDNVEAHKLRILATMSESVPLALWRRIRRIRGLFVGS